MNWKKQAIEDLQKHNSRKNSLINIPERIRALEAKNKAVKGVQTDKVPSHGGGTHYEDSLVDNIMEIERLKLLHISVNRLVNITERGLAALNEKERIVLDGFYINRKEGYIENLKQELIASTSEVYRIKDMAVYKFSINLYGIIDL